MQPLLLLLLLALLLNMAVAEWTSSARRAIGMFMYGCMQLLVYIVQCGTHAPVGAVPGSVATVVSKKAEVVPMAPLSVTPGNTIVLCSWLAHHTLTKLTLPNDANSVVQNIKEPNKTTPKKKQPKTLKLSSSRCRFELCEIFLAVIVAASRKF